MAFGALVIGDEILVGKRQDKHLTFIIQALAQRGLRLAWCEYHGDDRQHLIDEHCAWLASTQATLPTEPAVHHLAAWLKTTGRLGAPT